MENDLFHSHYPSAGNQIQCQIKALKSVKVTNSVKEIHLLLWLLMTDVELLKLGCGLV